MLPLLAPSDALPMPAPVSPGQRIAVVGTGIAGLSCAWLLSQRHEVTVFESEPRPGGHSHTVDAPGREGTVPVDTGFIVYNEPAYPNLTALFRHLRVPTAASDMSFAVSLDAGTLEYAGTDLRGLFAQKRNLARPRFWAMLRDLLRFYREAPRDAQAAGDQALDDYLDAHRYGRAFRDDHLYPMAAAIWSTPAAQVGRYPVAAFVRFCENHGLLQISGRPVWRTVVGGSREYVRRLSQPFADRIQLDRAVLELHREPAGVRLRTSAGWWPERFDQVVLATHADRSLALLDAPTGAERALLGALPYSRNLAVLHRDPALMPARRAVWSSWNYLGTRGNAAAPTVTYWMNRLQPHLPQGAAAEPLFLTLNPAIDPRPEHLIRTEVYDHPLFDAAAMAAQRQLWQLQGQRRTWFCGAYFGAGFHEDGLQAGLAVAEALGGVRRPWRVAQESGRIHLPQGAQTVAS
ncbi:putative NAD/FAD-binding protein [Variovorax boronicumulans]|uniref:NAD/FAD-binding protein n=1 Tax=Variovorax boronicumulans TaxID=436515 RepID=A0AAW8DTW7_9BURK|nr:FAD-dependent oxidoreductase [Variovorax boronicumulans]MDP9877550.1 putative NAD/FAD-binding protein [Variovorax boronicumulans]MDP9922835.1 putative NAD/FAD-binding protein [Variovorax boronicumulans]